MSRTWDRDDVIMLLDMYRRHLHQQGFLLGNEESGSILLRMFAEKYLPTDEELERRERERIAEGGNRFRRTIAEDPRQRDQEGRYGPDFDRARREQEWFG